MWCISTLQYRWIYKFKKKSYLIKLPIRNMKNRNNKQTDGRLIAHARRFNCMHTQTTYKHKQKHTHRHTTLSWIVRIIFVEDKVSGKIITKEVRCRAFKTFSADKTRLSDRCLSHKLRSELPIHGISLSIAIHKHKHKQMHTSTTQ